jgi:TRAP-type C4-dicarboxylate transport system permease small subunit
MSDESNITEIENQQTKSLEQPGLRIEDWITVTVMGFLALITFGNVIARYFTNQSFAWTEEFSIFLMMALTLIAGSAAAARDRNIRIEIFSDKGSPQRRRNLAITSSFASCLLYLLLAYLGSLLTWDEYRFGETSPGIGVPKWWYTIWLPLFSILIAIRSGVLLITQWRTK